MIRDNLELLDQRLDHLVTSIRSTRRLIRDIESTERARDEAALPADDADTLALMAALEARASQIQTSYLAGVEVFTSADPIVENGE